MHLFLKNKKQKTAPQKTDFHNYSFFLFKHLKTFLVRIKWLLHIQQFEFTDDSFKLPSQKHISYFQSNIKKIIQKPQFKNNKWIKWLKGQFTPRVHISPLTCSTIYLSRLLAWVARVLQISAVETSAFSWMRAISYGNYFLASRKTFLQKESSSSMTFLTTSSVDYLE